MSEYLRLGVNVDHVATIRQARGTRYPDPMEAGLLAEQAGADGITVHPREDRRHIHPHDVRALAAKLSVPMNLEMAVTDEMLRLAADVRPAHVCLVPEKREELTTEGGLDVAGQLDRVGAVVEQLRGYGCRVSLFIDAVDAQLQAAVDVGAPVIEIHTGHYAEAPSAQAAVLAAEIAGFAQRATDAGIEVHAGHGLHTDNVAPIASIACIRELNIGHALIARSIFVGLPTAIAEMRAAMDAARRG